MKRKKKQEFLLIGIVVVVGFVYLILYGLKERGRNEEIERAGIQTVGVVINKTITRSAFDFERYSVSFDFFVGDSLAQNSIYFNDKRYYENAIIGMKYEIKLLSDSSKTESLIYIDKPVAGEYSNILRERERIVNFYKDGRIWLRRNSKSLKDLGITVPQN